jgi:argininosuccinate lyase
VFDGEDTATGCLAVTTAVVKGLTLNREHAASAASGLLLATDVADYLVGRGLPFRKAHEVVGGLTRKLVAERRDFSSLRLEEWQAASPLFEGDIVSRITPRESVLAKQCPGLSRVLSPPARVLGSSRCSSASFGLVTSWTITVLGSGV